ncbi:MAG TPA: phosphoadenylyl-sulfate reductase [Candidatus Sulfotelmatobacter sp.]
MVPGRDFALAVQAYGERMAIASAFGVEGVALIDMAAKVWKRFHVFVLDTGFLFPETHHVIGQVEARYGVSVEHVLPALTPEAQVQSCGPDLWNHNPDLCCQLRKMEPLRRKLSGLGAWVTSIRRDQTPERAGIQKIEWDVRFGLVKINPLADWTEERVWDYVHRHQLHYNSLHDRHYTSIGCTHCTRAVQPGESPRAGRWPGFAKRECGLHTADNAMDGSELGPSATPRF